MTKHTKVYMDYFGYGKEDFCGCEVCGQRAVDVAHIVARSKFGTKRKEQQDNINNLIGLCRKCHYDYDFNNKWTAEQMQEIHNRFMENYGKFY